VSQFYGVSQLHCMTRLLLSRLLGSRCGFSTSSSIAPIGEVAIVQMSRPGGVDVEMLAYAYTGISSTLTMSLRGMSEVR